MQYTNMFANSISYSLSKEEIGKEDFLIGDLNGEPYSLVVRTNSFIPVSIIIFASSEEDAKERFLKAVQETAKHRGVDLENLQEKYDDDFYGNKNRISQIYQIILDGGLSIEPFNKGFVAKSPWASNDNLF